MSLRRLVNTLYNDVRSKGEQFARELYLKADLIVTPKPKLTDRQIIDAFIRGRGLDREPFSDRILKSRVSVRHTG